MAFRVALISISDHANYGLRCISANLKKHSFEVHNIHFANALIQDIPAISAEATASVCDVVAKLKPNIVGISIISTFGHATAAKIASLIKTMIDVKVIFGGDHPTMLPEFCLKDVNIDYVCVGEGEESMLELCQCLRDNKPTADIPGIMHKDTLTYIRRNPPLDLGSFPFQDIGNDNKLSIAFDGSVINGDPLLLETETYYYTRCSRGCPFVCTFCSNAHLRTLYDHGKYLRQRQVEDVISEIETHFKLKSSYAHIWFTDDTFPISPAWVKEFSEKYKERVGLPFTIWSHPTTIKEANIALLKAAGLQKVMVGIESGSDKTRKEVYGRPESKEAIIKSLNILHKYDIAIWLDFIIDHPWESPTELEETFDLVTEIGRPIKLTMHNLTLLPSTKLAKRAIDEGRTTEAEIIKNMAENPFESSRKYIWCRGVPEQNDHARSYWIFLILSAENSEIPMWFVRLLSQTRFLRTRPQLIVESPMLIWKDPGEFLKAIMVHNPTLGKIYLSNNYFIKKLQLLLTKEFRGLYFIAHETFKLLRRLLSTH